MKPLYQGLGLVYLLLTVIVPATSALKAVATEIVNSASAGGDNLQPTTSNRTSVTTGQAILELIKTGDRAAAEPGDTVVYRLALKNTGTSPANNISLTDTLPLGLRFLPQLNKNLSKLFFLSIPPELMKNKTFSEYFINIRLQC